MATANDLQFNSLINNLIKEGFLTAADAQKHYQDSQKKGVSLINYLVTNKFVNSTVIASKISIEFGVPFFDLDTINVKTLPLELVNNTLIQKMDELPAQLYEFVHHANRVRENAMNKLEELIPQAEVRQLSAIATVVGIMDDKIRLATGLATKRTETVQILPSREDMKELMSGFVDGLVGAAENRAGEIIDVEVEEQPESSGLLVLKG